MEPPFEGLRGVVSVTSGYTGGKSSNPSYDAVSGGGTGHVEAVEIVFDPALISYEQLLQVFWRNVDPTDATGQFCDKGQQYLSAIYVHDETQRRLATASRERLRSRFPVMETDVVAAGPFYPAEEDHQDYYKKNPVRYRAYKFGCGRSARLRSIWRR
jgi:peptide-methionine (S)-S-oxide reductase